MLMRMCTLNWCRISFSSVTPLYAHRLKLQTLSHHLVCMSTPAAKLRQEWWNLSQQFTSQRLCKHFLKWLWPFNDNDAFVFDGQPVNLQSLLHSALTYEFGEFSNLQAIAWVIYFYFFCFAFVFQDNMWVMNSLQIHCHSTVVWKKREQQLSNNSQKHVHKNENTCKEDGLA